MAPAFDAIFAEFREGVRSGRYSLAWEEGRAVLRYAGFDPDQARDELGRWAPDKDSGGGRSREDRSTHDDLEALVRDSLANPGETTLRYEYGKVGPEEAARLAELLGEDAKSVEGYWHSIDSHAIRHAWNKHGPDGERRSGQQPISQSDLLTIPDVVANPDAVEPSGETHGGLLGIRYRKRIDGHVFVVEEVRAGTKRLALVTAYKYPASRDQYNRAGPRAQTSETFLDMLQAPRAANPNSIIGSAAPELNPARYSLAADVQAAADATEREPTEAQRIAGNYRKGRCTIHGLPVTIETPKGAIRRGKSKSGREWSIEMPWHYGYIRRTESEADGDHLDVFLGPHLNSQLVFVIDQLKESGRFDEHKVMLGWQNAAKAKEAYLAAYQPSWRGFGAITPMTVDQFRAWALAGDTGKPLARRADRSATP